MRSRWPLSRSGSRTPAVDTRSFTNPPASSLGVYVLVAPEPDRQQPHQDDEVYLVLEGSGVLEVEGEHVPIKEGSALFVEAGADHRFSAYEHLCVLVIFERKPAEKP